MAVVDEVGCYFAHGRFAGEDACPESGRAEGTLEVAGVVWGVLFFVDRFEDADWTFVLASHDIRSRSTLVC